MKLRVNGSSSAGNSYVLTDSKGRMLLLELGLSEKVIKRSIGFNIPNVDCCVVSHSHGDHARALRDVLKWGVPVIGPPQLFEGLTESQRHFARPIEPKQGVRVGSWGVFTLPLVHDVQCYGYVISHEEMGNTLFITDTSTCDYRINDLHHILIEANYDGEILKQSFLEGLIDKGGMNRIKESHMELQETIRILRETDLTQVNEIVLIHSSSRHSDYYDFKRTIESEFGKVTYMARPDLEIDFNKEPF